VVPVKYADDGYNISQCVSHFYDEDILIDERKPYQPSPR
jgi:hypothetical protein